MDGIINIYKPCGITSFDVVRKIKKISGTQKVGHAGTLDPAACGVLPVAIGRATKIIDYIMNNSKIYIAQLKLGTVTDTYDREGKILESNPVNASVQEVEDAIYSFVGEIDQVPPMYSALKVNGKRLYELARQGIEIERNSRKINIYHIHILKMDLPDVVFEVHCSKGTYIRSLCYDIGSKLNCGGAMWALERSGTGLFTKANSIPLEDLTTENIGQYIISVENALQSFEELHIDAKYEKLILNGVQIANPNLLNSIKSLDLCRVYLGEKNFIGLGKKEEGHFKMVKLLI